MSSTPARKKFLKVALLGTRGIPANYGGFETFAEELSTRLVQRGHAVTVYGRSNYVESQLRSHRGVRIRVLPAVRSKYLETVTHTALCVAVVLFEHYDIVLICNAANAFACWVPKLAGQKVVLNVDGIERLRKKWNRIGKAYYRFSEFLSTVIPDQTITDARCIQDYYREEYGFRTRFIPYGATNSPVKSREELDRLGLEPQKYVLYVSRFEPENNADLVLEAYLASGVDYPLVMVGDAPYSRSYMKGLRERAAGKNVLLTGAIYGRGYQELLSHCLCYVHATEVGGSHPALIEAMGAGCLIVVNDTSENREVAQSAALFYPFNDLRSLIRLLQALCSRPEDFEEYRRMARDRADRYYDWEKIVTEYEVLFRELTES